MKISRGITTHGFALNVGPDLSFFDGIVPCGITDRGVTSMERLLGRAIGIQEVAPSLVRHLGLAFGMEMLWAAQDDSIWKVVASHLQERAATQPSGMS